jgi:hypothetical protein
LLSILLALLFPSASFANTAYYQLEGNLSPNSLDVKNELFTFSGDETAVYPGMDEITSYITLKNNGSENMSLTMFSENRSEDGALAPAESQPPQTAPRVTPQAVNGPSPSAGSAPNLSDVLWLKVEMEGGMLYEGWLSGFDKAALQELKLPELSPGESATLKFSASMWKGADSRYNGLGADFDVFLRAENIDPAHPVKTLAPWVPARSSWGFFTTPTPTATPTASPSPGNSPAPAQAEATPTKALSPSSQKASPHPKAPLEVSVEESDETTRPSQRPLASGAPIEPVEEVDETSSELPFSTYYPLNYQEIAGGDPMMSSSSYIGTASLTILRMPETSEEPMFLIFIASLAFLAAGLSFLAKGLKMESTGSKR